MIVKYIGCSKEQQRWGGNDNPQEKGLVIGNIYEVSSEEQHSWHTKFYLVGIEGKFNSVCFIEV
jgi:hypothetical protein